MVSREEKARNPKWYQLQGKKYVKVLRYCATCRGSYHYEDTDPGCMCGSGFLTKEELAVIDAAG